MERSFTIYGLVRKLTGPIMPTGQHEHDIARLTNLNILCDLIHMLIKDVDNVVYENHDPQEQSVKDLVNMAKKLFDDLGIEE